MKPVCFVRVDGFNLPSKLANVHVHVHDCTCTFPLCHVKDLIHGAPIGKPVAARAKVTAVYGEDEEDEIQFTRM